MRTVGVVTTSRADYSIYSPILNRIQNEPELELRLIVSGSHLSPEFGMTAQLIESDGFEIDYRVEMLLSSDTPEGIGKSIGIGCMGFAQTYANFRPDILLVLGDRFEMHAAALAALPFNIPVAHIHGGEITEGAIDEALRHSITKLSHLHFVSTREHGDTVIQMGEEPWRVTVSGAPSLDNFQDLELLGRHELEKVSGLRLTENTLIVTYHPVTLEYEQTEWQVGELLAALHDSSLPIVITLPNADTNAYVVKTMMEEFSSTHDKAQLVNNLGPQLYFSLMACAAAMVGNSSSGIIEAASFDLPVVNIGNRQQGRTQSNNVINVGYGRDEIIDGVNAAIDPKFRKTLKGDPNVYGDGHAADRIITKLKNTSLSEDLTKKRFYRVSHC